MQLASARGNWAEAEERLELALTATEAAAGAQHARVGLILGLLAGVYKQSLRLTLSEGLLRSASTMVGMPEDDHFARPPPGLRVAPSAAINMAWQLSQILALNPRRRGEAAQWIARAACIGLARPLSGAEAAAVAAALASGAPLAAPASEEGGELVSLRLKVGAGVRVGSHFPALNSELKVFWQRAALAPTPCVPCSCGLLYSLGKV